MTTEKNTKKGTRRKATASKAKTSKSKDEKDLMPTRVPVPEQKLVSFNHPTADPAVAKDPWTDDSGAKFRPRAPRRLF